MSLDGFIAGPNGEYDWIPMDSTVDFAALFDEFDTLLMGRKTYEVLQAQGPGGPATGKQIVVVSRTITANQQDITVISDRIAERVAALKATDGKDIWLFGGSLLFRELLDAQLVDTVELAVIPVFLSRGIPVLAPGKMTSPFQLQTSRVLPSGIVLLTYTVNDSAAPKERA